MGWWTSIVSDRKSLFELASTLPQLSHRQHMYRFTYHVWYLVKKIVTHVDACRHAADWFKLRVKIGRPTSWLIGFWDHIALSGNGNWDHFCVPPMPCRLCVVWGKDVSKRCMKSSTLFLCVKFQAFSRLVLAFSRTRQHHKVWHCWP